ncbi:MAG: right-handed parallel beta-helix repeat-containing protein [Planctomycetota bacterium]|nr:right-handed parallel beta-helix repeat-containing protein [Planctomycetota bacterium]
MQPANCRTVVALAFVCASLSAQTYFVREKGSDQNDGKTPDSAFRNVLLAAQVLDNGDSLVIGPGTYKGTAFFADRFSADGSRMNVSGDESGKLTGDAPGPVILEPINATDPVLHFCRFQHLTVSGVTVRGAGQGIKLEKCRDVIVERCSFEGATRGLIADGVEGLRVESCVFARCTLGLFLSGCVDSRIAHITVAASTSAGVMVLSCGAGRIRNSLLAANNSHYVADALSGPAWTSDHNALQGPTGPWGNAPAVYNIYEWFALSGQERHSVYITPSFVDPDANDFHIAPAVGWGGGLPGMNAGEPLTPPMQLDRGGRPFRVRDGAVCAGAWDYPDPQPSGSWKSLDVPLAFPAVRQSAALYRPDGTLVRTLLADAAGVRQLWWNGLDDLGQPAGQGTYEVRSIAHDVRLVDEGSIGDNGNAKGIWNCDQADCVAVFPDGRFAITAVYDEAGYALRCYAASGQSVFASSFTEGGFWAIAPSGEDLIGGLGEGANAKIVRLAPPGERAMMASGAESYPIFAPEEKDAKAAGLTVVKDAVYVAVPSLNLVRVISLATGKKTADWPLPGIADVARDDQGTLWALAGTDVVSLTPDGQVDKRYATGLQTPQYLAAGSEPAHGLEGRAPRLAAVDRKAAKIALHDAASGKVVRTLGQARAPGEFVPVSADLFRDPRRAAFLPDGRLLVTEGARVRALWPETAKTSFELLSNFMDTAVVHPTQPEYVYCYLGVFRVHPKTGAWTWLVEEPQGQGPPGKDGKPTSLSFGSPNGAVVLGGRPFIVYHNTGNGTVRMLDVTDPLKPRQALLAKPSSIGGWAYATFSFTKDGDIVSGPKNYSLLFNRIKFKGLDPQNNPTFDFDKPEVIGLEKDPSPRGMKHIEALSCDRLTGDIYYLAVTNLYNKMVPGWGADGTGIGRSAPDGKQLWFSLSTGGNYMSISTVNDGKAAWVLAAKSFGGQMDVYNPDGLHVTTGNWGWSVGYAFGFVDMRYGVHGYVRPDGKVGAYVEDDAIGRFGRCRLDGAETLQRKTATVTWDGGGTPGQPPLFDRAEGQHVSRVVSIPKVAPLKLDGDWAAWEKAGVPTQVVSLPCSVGFKRTMPGDLMQTFRAGTLLGGIAHDGQAFYLAFVVADDTPHFDAPAGADLWRYDGIELWVEEEQVGFGFLKDGTPAAYKWRQHNREGKDWAANYALPRESIWGAKLADLATHPLGRRLAAITGVPFDGKPGYALMVRLPFEEVKLVGGIAGRKGGEILPLAGTGGELVRIAVALDGLSAFGRCQDYQVDWPVGRMFADPTRSCPFVLGR